MTGETLWHMTGYCAHRVLVGERVTRTHYRVAPPPDEIESLAEEWGLSVAEAMACHWQPCLAFFGDIYSTKREALLALIEYSTENLHDAERALRRSADGDEE